MIFRFELKESSDFAQYYIGKITKCYQYTESTWKRIKF